jgi:hypothetical protein
MSPLELSLAVVSGLLGAGGTWAWVKVHTHPELVSRTELEPQLGLILGELRYLRDRLDNLFSPR